MAQYLTIARPYVAALFEADRSSPEKLSAWERVLEVSTEMVSETAILQLVFDPKVTKQNLHKLMMDVITTIVPVEAARLGAHLKNFLSLLIESKRLNALPDMLTIFKQLLALQQKVMRVDVSSAFELDEDQLDDIKAALSKRFNTDVAIQFSIDKSLIGGAVIRTDEFVLDGSIKDRIRRLYDSLNS